jgi:hypothetical protein
MVIMKTVVNTSLLIFVLSTTAHASLIGTYYVGNNETLALQLAGFNPTLLTLLAKDDGPDGTLNAGAINPASWSVTSDGKQATWTIGSSLVAPSVSLVKFDNLINVFSYMGPAGPPWTDTVSTATHPSGVTIPPTPPQGNMNPNADISHVSVYGQPGGPITQAPEPASLVVWALFGVIATAAVWFRQR